MITNKIKLILDFLGNNNKSIKENIIFIKYLFFCNISISMVDKIKVS